MHPMLLNLTHFYCCNVVLFKIRLYLKTREKKIKHTVTRNQLRGNFHFISFQCQLSIVKERQKEKEEEDERKKLVIPLR